MQFPKNYPGACTIFPEQVCFFKDSSSMYMIKNHVKNQTLL